MSAGPSLGKRLESEIARILEIMGHVRGRPDSLNEADTKAKAAFIDPILSALGWELRDPFSDVKSCDVMTEGNDQSIRRRSKGSAAPDEHLPGDGLGSADEPFCLSCGPPIV